MVKAADEHEHGKAGFDTPLASALSSYLEYLDARVAARAAAKDGVRVGIAPGTAYLARQALRELRNWLVESGRDRITTGELNRRVFEDFVLHLGSTPGPRGPRSAASISRISRNIKTFVRWLDAQEERLIRRVNHLVGGLKPPKQNRPAPHPISPSDLVSFFRSAIARERGEPTTVQRQKQNGPVEVYRQRMAPPDLSVPRLFLLLAALGCRLHEALSLRWDGVDLERGVITIPEEGKTGSRFILLDDERQGYVAPELIPLLRAWRLESPPDWPHVLVTRSGKRPDRRDKHGRWRAFPRRSWNSIAAELGIHLTPQMLRRSWVSYAAACGVPATVAALWAGHSMAVAQRWYLGQVKNTRPGESTLAAMGLAAELWRSAPGASPSTDEMSTG